MWAASYYLFEIPLDWAAKSKIYIATHATAGNETIWGGQWDDEGGPAYQYNWDKKWGGYFSTCVAPVPVLPTDPVEYRAWHWGAVSYWNIAFTAGDPPGMPPGKLGDYWVGWCADNQHSMSSGARYMVTLYSSYDPNIPDSGDMPILNNGNWEYVNFMLNQRRNPDPGSPFFGVNWTVNSNKQQLQNAIWFFTNNAGVAAGSLAEQLVQYAVDNGDNYIPCEGEYYAIILYPNTDPTDIFPRAQMNIIEVDP